MYFARKRVQHGSNYGMKGRTMSDQILKDSYKLYGEPCYLSPDQCELEQHYYFSRYPGVIKWHQRIKQQLKNNGYLIAANGHKRIFFGRRDDYDTFKQACADEPQENTTHAINTALLKLWSDPENRFDRGADQGVSEPPPPTRLRRCISLRVQPLHQIHDAILGQFKKDSTPWAIAKIRAAFDNPMTIAGQRVVIPFEGAYGESWGNLHEGSI
jgi:DNA polymerase I-like protein with 3'-5' exonuclease and polymerase domains